MKKEVRVTTGVPPATLFTSSDGTPIVIDITTGVVYYLDATGAVQQVVAAGTGDLPPGGTLNQILAKNSATNFDFTWQDPYSHPVSHPPSIITQDTDNRFVTDVDITNWNSGLYGKEEISNKVTSWQVPTTNTNYPSEKLVRDTILALEPVDYPPATMTVNTGTLDGGTVASLTSVNGVLVSISEASGADPLRVTFTFAGVTRLSSFAFYGYYAGSTSHQLAVEIYNYATPGWDSLGLLGTTASAQWHSFFIHDAANYMSAGAASTRLRHVQNGVSSHDLFLDHLELNYGGLGSSGNVDATSVSFMPSGNLVADNVGAALVELDTEKEVSGTTATHSSLTSGVHGAGLNTLIYSDDLRLTDARTPTAHNQAESTITFTDITTGNVSSTAHGFAPKFPNNTTTFLRGDGTYAAPTAGSGDVVGDDTATTAQNIVAYTGTGGKNITELTGTQGDILYHNGTSWAKLAASTDGFFLRTRGASVNPAWAPPTLYNQSVTNQGAGFATDTYVTGANILVPLSAMKVGTRYYCMMRVSKTNAGTATPIINIRFGTNGSTADTSRGTLTWTAGTAAIDDGVIEIWMTVLTSGATGTIRTVGRITHKLSVTGLTGTAAVSESEVADSGTFDQTVANSYIGLSLNAGTSAAWTVHMVQSRLENLL